MGFSKTLVSGSAGSVVVSEAAGNFTLTASLNAALGGGTAAGVAKASASLAVDLEAAQLIDLGFALAAAKFPSAAAVIKLAQDAVDAELAKA